MGILKTYLLVFIVGWVGWFMLDKSGPAAPAPAVAGGPFSTGAPYPRFPSGPSSMPSHGEGGMVQVFQYGVDLAKRGHYQQAFVYLWRRESWVLAAVVSALLSMLLPAAWRGVGQWRRRRGQRSELR